MSIEVGRRTCVERSFYGKMCGACDFGFTWEEIEEPRYCPNCGMKFERYEYRNGEIALKSA